MIYRNGYKQCEECGNNTFDLEGWGTDENGDFSDYICEECGTTLRQYEDI